MEAGNQQARGQGISTPRTFALRSGRVPFFTPLIFGFVAGLSAIDVARKSPHQLSSMALDLTGVLAAVLAMTLASSLLRRGIPDGLRLTDTALELLRGRRIVRRVDLTRLKEVSEFQVQTGKVLLVADRHRHITLPSFALAEARHYEDLTHQIVEAMARIDPSGRVARGAVRAGRLRETIAQQPVRGTFVLAALVCVASAFAFGNLDNLAGIAFPEEAVGALSAPLVFAGETYRLFSYVFLHASGMHLAVCAVGILYIGAYLEKLLGWERVVIGFVAGTLGGALGQILLAPPVPGVGAGGALFGLFGLLGAVALLKRRLPPTLVPHSGFWILTVFLALLLPATAEPPVPPPHIPLGIVSPEVAAAILRELVAITSMYIGGAALGFLVGVIIVLGLDIPASDESRRGARPFALLGCLALGIGLVGGVTLPRKNHALDTEIVGRALIDLPKGDESAALQNAIAYPRLTDSRSKPEAIEMAARLAAAAVDNTDRENPVALRTLAFARYQQGQVGEARSLISEAIRLVKDRPDLPDTLMLKELQQHEEDMDKGTTLRPPAPPDDLDR